MEFQTHPFGKNGRDWRSSVVAVQTWAWGSYTLLLKPWRCVCPRESFRYVCKEISVAILTVALSIITKNLGSTQLPISGIFTPTADKISDMWVSLKKKKKLVDGGGKANFQMV